MTARRSRRPEERDQPPSKDARDDDGRQGQDHEGRPGAAVHVRVRRVFEGARLRRHRPRPPPLRRASPRPPPPRHDDRPAARRPCRNPRRQPQRRRRRPRRQRPRLRNLPTPAVPPISNCEPNMARTDALLLSDSLPRNSKALLNLLGMCSDEVQKLVQGSQFGFVYQPTMLGKDIALALENYLNEVPERAARPGIGRDPPDGARGVAARHVRRHGQPGKDHRSLQPFCRGDRGGQNSVCGEALTWSDIALDRRRLRARSAHRRLQRQDDRGAQGHHARSTTTTSTSSRSCGSGAAAATTRAGRRRCRSSTTSRRCRGPSRSAKCSSPRKCRRGTPIRWVRRSKAATRCRPRSSTCSSAGSSAARRAPTRRRSSLATCRA